jgi:phospholipase/carboxylesterase
MADATNKPFTSFAHRFVPGTGNPYTLLLLHGTGGDENSLVELASDLMPAVNLLSPRGKVLEHGMPRFFRRLAEGVFDEQDLHVRTHELIEFVGQAAAHYGFDPTRVVALGYSNGANVAASILLTDPTVLAGAALLRAMVPFEPSELLRLPATPILLLSGNADPMIPLQSAIRLADLLKASGGMVTHRTVRSGHSLTENEFVVLSEWLNEVCSNAGE